MNVETNELAGGMAEEQIITTEDGKTFRRVYRVSPDK